MFSGSITALVTPMHANGEIDFAAAKRLVERQIEAGANGLVVCGSTGEAATLSQAESIKLLEAVVQQTKKRIPVIAGTGNYSTQVTIDKTRAAMEAGADACLLVTPYYNKPTQEGLYQHFKAVAQAVPIPQILYNIPGRTGCDMLPTTVEKLSHIPNIVGLKEASISLVRAEELILRCGERMNLFTSDDIDTLPAILLGFKGAISVTGNIAPNKMQRMVHAVLKGDSKTARELNQQLMPLHKNLFIETNPIPAKWLLAEKKLMESGIRLPLVALSEQHHATLRQLLDLVE